MHGMEVVGKLMRALGLMSGTSMDGIDVALIETDGEGKVEAKASATIPYSAEFRARITAGLAEARSLTDRYSRPGSLAALERELTDLHAQAVKDFLVGQRLKAREIDVIGFHGHTVLHRPAPHIRTALAAEAGPHGVPRIEGVPEIGMLTVQLGDGPRLAEVAGIDVVYDMRANDCAHGGQGAPLVPAYHRALAIGLRRLPLAFVNIGGVANVTWVGGDGRLIAFDTGPGNAMIDDWMRKHANADHDAGGAAALRGTVHQDYLAAYLKHSYFADAPPKSLDRNAFALELIDELSTDDGAATLAAFTAASIAKAREHFPDEPALWIVCGGGRRNKAIMSNLAGHVENAVVPAEAVGIDGDGLEAAAWAYLAVRSLRGLPISFPGTTGVSRPLTGGRLARAPR